MGVWIAVDRGEARAILVLPADVQVVVQQINSISRLQNLARFDGIPFSKQELHTRGEG